MTSDTPAPSVCVICDAGEFCWAHPNRRQNSISATPSAAPDDTRRTFVIPEGYEAVMDAEGRATGETRPTAAPDVEALIEDLIGAVGVASVAASVPTDTTPYRARIALVVEALRTRLANLTERAKAAEAELARTREALTWYGEQARLARLIHHEGDAGRHALQEDGGKRATAALAKPEPAGEKT